MRLKRFVLAFLILFAFPASQSEAQTLIPRGWVVNSIDNDSGAAPLNGAYFSVPQGQALSISMQTSFASAPGSVTIELQSSLDASIWTTIATTTSTTGQLVFVGNHVTKFIRARESARAGGSGVTASLLVNYVPTSQIGQSLTYSGTCMWQTDQFGSFAPCPTNPSPSISVSLPSTDGFIYWGFGTNISSPANGVLTFQNVTLNGFGRVNFGPATSSFPALGRNGTRLELLLGDNTSGGGLFVPNGGCTAPALSSPIDSTDGFNIASNVAGQFCVNGIEVGRFTANGLQLGASGAQGTFSGRAANVPIVNTGGATFSAAAPGSVTVGGVLCVNTTSQATTGTVEEVLATCTVPANAMSANGKGIRVTAWGLTANNANSKRMRIRFGGIGGSVIADGASTTALAIFRVSGEIIRTGAATQVASGIQTAGVSAAAAVVTHTTAAPTQTLSNAIDIVITGLTPTAAGDLTFTALIVEFFN